MDEEKKENKKMKKQRMPKGMIPAEGQDRIYQPYAMAMTRYDYSLMQQKVFSSIVYSLQEPIKQVLSGMKVEDVTFFQNKDNLFVDEEDCERFRVKIYPKNMNVPRKHYAFMKDSILKMRDIPVEILEKDKDGNSFTRVESLIVPHFPNEKKLDYFYIDIRKVDAIKLIEGKTYINYLFSTVVNAKRSYTPRIYIYISAWRGKTVTPKTRDFRRMLCLMKDQNELQKDKYIRFSELCRCVIDPTQKELYDKAMNGETDCYFEYRPIYKTGKCTGEPDNIEFKVILSESGKKLDGESLLKRKKMEAANVLAQQFKWEAGFISEVLSMTDEKTVDNLYQAINRTDERINSRQIDNIAHYSYVYLIDVFNRLNKGEGIEENKPVDNMPQLPFKEDSIEEMKPILEGEETNLWNIFLGRMQERVTKQIFDSWFPQIVFTGVETEGDKINIVIQVPSSSFMEVLYSKIDSKLFHEAFFTTFGEEYKMKVIKKA